MIAAAGGEVRLGARVRRLLQRPNGGAPAATGVELENGETIHARAVVAALPPQDLLRIVPSEWRHEHDLFSELSEFHPCPYISVFLWFDRKLTRRRFWARPWHPRDLNCDFYDLSNIHRGWSSRPSLICSNIIYSHRAADLSDAEIEARTIREISEVFPEAASAKVVHRVINRIPMAIHCPFPGTERRRPEVRSPIEGLTLAGDWIKTNLPSSMESAARSGWLAAEEVRRNLGAPSATLAIEHPELSGFAGLIHAGSRVLPLKRLPMWVHGLG
jgi:15-cis-phytoene desaturase